MNKAFYIVMCNYAMIDSIGNVVADTHALSVHLTKKEAKDALREASQDVREYTREHESWFVFADNGVIFDAGEKDCYKNEHARFYIERVEQECDGPNVMANDILSAVEKVKNATLEKYRGSITRSAYECDIDRVYEMIECLLTAQNLQKVCEEGLDDTPRNASKIEIGTRVKDKMGREFIVFSYECLRDTKGQTETIRVMRAEDEGNTIFAVNPYTPEEFYEEFSEITSYDEEG